MSKLETSVHVRISKEAYEALVVASKKIGVSVAWIMRHGAMDYLSRKGYLRK